jgi:hypothetical protein
MGTRRLLDLRHRRRRDRTDRSDRTARRRNRRLGAARRQSADDGGDPQTRSRPRRRPLRPRYGARAFGPWLFWRHNVPETELEGIEPGSELPGGFVALYDGRGRNETPLWLPEQRAIVFADGLTSQGGELRIWETPHEERARLALRELLELPFEHVIVSHGDPVHDRAAYERALDLPMWAG